MRVALVVLDGWGLADHDRRNAIEAAHTPTFDRLETAGASGTLDVAGRRVGLPEGQMGNSEIGHRNLGAGRVVRHASTRIDDAVAAWRGEPVVGDPEPFADAPALVEAFDHARRTGGRVHLIGLVSPGGVHSDQAHCHALIELAAQRGVPAVTHAVTDGRDTPPRAAASYLGALADVVAEHGTGDVATVCGRYYAMDRDGNWDRTRRAYDAVVDRVAQHEVSSPRTAVEAAHGRGEDDEFIAPTVVEGGEPVRDGDAVIWFNFRSDRARQFVRLLGGLDAPLECDPPDVRLVTMTEYDETFPFPVVFAPVDPPDVLGAVLADAGCTQLRAAESEKGPHVTYFLNGGRERAFEGERRLIVPSPDVPTYDEMPAMHAPALTDRVRTALTEDDPDVLVLNYANPDMVGHTGDHEAAVAAVEAVDTELDRLAAAVADAGGHLCLTADHGNADDMGTVEAPRTAHTANPVPFVYMSPMAPHDGGRRIRSDGSLCDVAPTLLGLAGIERPSAMTGRSLLVDS